MPLASLFRYASKMTTPSTPVGSSATPRTKVGLLLAGTMLPATVDIIARTIHTCKDADFYLLNSKGVTRFEPEVDANLGTLLSVRNALTTQVRESGSNQRDADGLVQDYGAEIKGMVLLADSHEPTESLAPLILASGRPAIELLDRETFIPRLAKTRELPEGFTLLMGVPKLGMKMDALVDTIGMIAQNDTLLGQAQIDVFSKELSQVGIVPFNGQGVGSTDDYVCVYEPKGKAITLVSKNQARSFAYTSGSDELITSVCGYDINHTLTEAQREVFNKKLTGLDKIVRKDIGLER